MDGVGETLGDRVDCRAVIKYGVGDVLSYSAQTLVSAVNLRGSMGRGISLRFKDRFSGLFQAYTIDILETRLAIGSPTIWKGPEKWIVNFPTKDDWRRPAQYDYIEKGLVGLRGKLDEWGVLSLAMPALGCGFGSLDWNVVKSMIEKHLGKIEMAIEVYEP